MTTGKIQQWSPLSWGSKTRRTRGHLSRGHHLVVVHFCGQCRIVTCLVGTDLPGVYDVQDANGRKFIRATTLTVPRLAPSNYWVYYQDRLPIFHQFQWVGYRRTPSDTPNASWDTLIASPSASLIIFLLSKAASGKHLSSQQQMSATSHRWNVTHRWNAKKPLDRQHWDIKH